MKIIGLEFGVKFQAGISGKASLRQSPLDKDLQEVREGTKQTVWNRSVSG